MNSETITAITKDIKNLALWRGGTTVSWKNNSYPAVRSRLSYSQSLDVGGTLNNYSGSVTLLLRDFQTENPPGSGNWVTGELPSPGDIVIIKNNQYQIDRVVYDEANPCVTLHLLQYESPLS
jgi:hypothetical protein